MRSAKWWLALPAALGFGLVPMAGCGQQAQPTTAEDVEVTESGDVIVRKAPGEEIDLPPGVETAPPIGTGAETDIEREGETVEVEQEAPDAP